MGSTCPNCGTENPERARFCMSCGAGLSPSCPNCGAENPPGAKFCIECGTAFAGEAAPAPGEAVPGSPGATAPAWPEAPREAADSEPLPEERRQVSVLFADLSGYTAVAEQMDPEAVKQMLDRTLRKLGEEVTRFGGRVDKYIGDNVMAVFGAPQSHEDDPERAVRAGLAMQETMERLNERHAPQSQVNFLLRVGINTGEVLAGRMGDGYTVIGDAVNVAARLQAAARPGTVTVGESTYRATREAISYDELEPLTLKGKAEPVPAWEARDVLDEQPARRTAGRPGAPLVGRVDESALLLELAQRVERESRPHLVTVIGQAGVGKSRLMREFGDRIAELDPEPKLLSGECPPYGSGISYWALGEMVRAEFGIGGGEPNETAWAKLHDGMVERLEGTEAEGAERNAALIARMLGIEPPEGAPSLESEDPQRMRESLFSAIRVMLEAISSRGPLVVAFEDIHWADEGMLDLIEHLARWMRGPMLLVCLARDELLDRRTGWGGGRRNATSIYLDPLSDTETEAAGREPLRQRQPRAGQPGRRAGGRQPAVRGGDGQPASGGRRRARGAARDGPLGARRPARLAGAVRAPSAPAGRRGRAELLARRPAQGVRPERGPGDRCAGLAAGQGAGDRQPGQPPGRRARVRLQARADPRRRLRDAAQGDPLPPALPGRRLHRGAGRRGAATGRWR